MPTFLRRPEVTVAVPMFQAGAYLETCLQSIARQSYDVKRLEVLCVDDGSADDTVDLARRFLKELKLKGTVSSHPNSGSPAQSRNTALDNARGKFIHFVDVDDYLGPKAIESMTTLATHDDADVIIGRYEGVGRGVPRVLFEKTRARTDLLESPVLDSMNVLKMYRTDYARSLPYRFNSALRMAEDHPFAMASYLFTDRIAIQADEPCYYWVRHSSEAGAEQHLTGHTLPVDDFYAYMYEVFKVIDDAQSTHPERAAHARSKYWNRLLHFDVPIEMRRKRSTEERQHSIDTIRRILDENQGWEARGLGRKATAMRHSLRVNDPSLIKSVARII
ncbi:glycosyltransferase family 2 protein [Glutamicibacter endophyticus]|uniref:glycosyltransferase family 2 protein n=1 Tax=Glutamicibacter endophyticus TaxID=1522174 RepID=UPI003AEF4DEB